ncbi:DUF2254 domain-containing protein [Sphingomicrobium marinum]|uniref:DUF2254 domain-containing protein n=1 Tax=Sphingomicrobium marinum TaxID=1227950 RepID=UPI00223ED88D|nr:DUF2254 domain-containing protein [Sphingomicrobium marinum]
MPRWRFILARMVERIWFRAALIGLLSVALALAAALLAPLIPYKLSLSIGASAVDDILTILASSMLAVTTFSLTAMVTAFSGAAAHITPRATKLLIEDATAQNALSTFLGGFLFAIVGIIALSTGIYGGQGRAILFIGTILVIAVIVLTLLNWIGRLGNFGRVQDAIERIEAKAISALDHYPGPRVILHEERRPDAGTTIVTANRTGYVAHIDRSRLSDAAAKAGVQFTLSAPAGTFVDPTRPLGWCDGSVNAEQLESMRDAAIIEPSRDFDQDPRFGMVVLAEIGSRALSPGINDPGTAIAVLGAGQRVLDSFSQLEVDTVERASHVIDAPISFEDMVTDLILPLARDGAGIFEVGIRLQQMLGALAQRIPRARGWLLGLAQQALEQARAAIEDKRALERVEDAHRSAFAEAQVPLDVAERA